MDAISEKELKKNLSKEVNASRDLEKKWADYHYHVYLRGEDTEARETLSYWDPVLTKE